MVVPVPLPGGDCFRALVRFRDYDPIWLRGLSPRVIYALYRQEFRRAIQEGWMPDVPNAPTFRNSLLTRAPHHPDNAA